MSLINTIQTITNAVAEKFGVEYQEVTEVLYSACPSIVKNNSPRSRASTTATNYTIASSADTLSDTGSYDNISIRSGDETQPTTVTMPEVTEIDYEKVCASYLNKQKPMAFDPAFLPLKQPIPYSLSVPQQLKLYAATELNLMLQRLEMTDKKYNIVLEQVHFINSSTDPTWKSISDSLVMAANVTATLHNNPLSQLKGTATETSKLLYQLAVNVSNKYRDS